MPYLNIQTNRPIPEGTHQELLHKASQLVAEQLGKPERYVMIALAPPAPMLFAGEDAPAAFLELKSIGLPRDRTPALSAALCDLLEETLAIPPERVYIEFADAPRDLWGWDSATF